MTQRNLTISTEHPAQVTDARVASRFGSSCHDAGGGGVGASLSFGMLARRDARAQAYRDVFTAVPKESDAPTPPPPRHVRSLRLFGALVVSFAALAACAQEDGGFAAGPLEARVIEVFPHDPNAFTQGLIVHDGVFYESTGRYGQSSLRRVDIETGQVEQLVSLSSAYFAEGLTLLNNRLYQLTWQKGVAFVYDLDTFESVGSFSYEGEGWGLTHDSERLILSDGTPRLRYLDPDSFEVVGTIEVRDGGRPVNNLNELEFVEGEIWANVWYDDRVVRVDPANGNVLGWIDLSRIYPRSRRGSEDVLNGIAYDAGSGRTFVTGKNWPVLFEIELEPVNDSQR